MTASVIAVTGGTGLTGRFVLSEIRKRAPAAIIRCLVRPTSDTSGLPEENLCTVTGDCRDLSSLLSLITDSSAVIHLAGIAHGPTVVEACRRTNVDRLVVVGSTGIFAYHRRGVADRLRIEETIKQSGLKYTIIRPTMIYGNHMDINIKRLVKFVNRFPIIPVFGESARLQPIYARDLASAIVSSVFSDCSIGKEYNVAGREPITYGQILRLIADALGKKRVFVPVPYTLALVAGWLGELLHSPLIFQRQGETTDFGPRLRLQCSRKGSGFLTNLF